MSGDLTGLCLYIHTLERKIKRGKNSNMVLKNRRYPKTKPKTQAIQIFFRFTLPKFLPCLCSEEMRERFEALCFSAKTYNFIEWMLPF